jgi:hypothetical protein
MFAASVSRPNSLSAAQIAGLLIGLVMSTQGVAAAEPQPPPWPQQVERNEATVFVSGHSLTDQPIPDYLEAIARSLGAAHVWNRQYVVGSSIQRRTRGENPQASDWPGYRQGDNKDGSDLDVVAELRSPKTTGGKPYDVLLITEMHGLLISYLWLDTVRMLRHYHDVFISGNPQGRTYFYESWLSLLNKSAPASWIAYERKASPIWQCAATRINISLEHAGRKDRITPLPAGLALAELIARATEGKGLPGITAGSPRETVDRFLSDDVHLTSLGKYYMALVSYAAIYGRSPVGAWAPDGVDGKQAEAMQQFAWSFISDFYARSRPLPLAECRKLIANEFNQSYWNYRLPEQSWSPAALLREADAWWRRQRDIRRSAQKFSAEDASNPFFFSPEIDASYWYPAP